MTKAKTHFVCQSCGYQAPKWLGKCPGCQEWNTFVEERVIEEKVPERDLLGFESEAVPTPLTEIVGEERGRFQSGIGEFDRVLGGGIVFGSVILVGGDPGIGKSTLLLQVMSRLSLKREEGPLRFRRRIAPADQDEGRSVRSFFRTPPGRR